MKTFFFLVTMVLAGVQLNAQPDIDYAEHQIIFQLTSADTNVHKMLVRQLTNVLNGAPNAKLEVVCHGPGLSMVVTKQTTMHPKIKDLTNKGVHFVACENTMKDRNISRDQIVPESGFVPVGILEIVTKQEQGWSYIRAAE
jgi:intracellular sulfur oxidation DsrE/DsrF family protein